MKKIIIVIIKIIRKFIGLFNKILYLEYRSKYNISKDFRFNGEGILMVGDGDIDISENSYIGRFSSIQVAKNCKVKIGKNCKISHFVKIYTQSAYADQDFNEGLNLGYSKDVIIEDGVWIGANVFINPGITVGRNSVVGANSVLTKDVPANCIVGGVPARIIRYKAGFNDGGKV